MKRWLRYITLTACVVGCFFTLMACQSKSVDSSKGVTSSISKGLDAAAQGNMNKAVGFFESALDQDSKNQKAKAYLKQAELYVAADKLLSDGQPLEAERKLDNVSEVKGSKVLTRKLTELKATVKKKADEYRALDKQMETLKTQITSKDVTAADSLAGTIAKTDWTKKPWLKRLEVKFGDLNKQVLALKSSVASSQSAINSSITASSSAAAASASSASNVALTQEHAIRIAESRKAEIAGVLGGSRYFLTDVEPNSIGYVMKVELEDNTSGVWWNLLINNDGTVQMSRSTSFNQISLSNWK